MVSASWLSKVFGRTGGLVDMGVFIDSDKTGSAVQNSCTMKPRRKTMNILWKRWRTRSRLLFGFR